MKYLLKYIHECCFRLLETHSCTLISLYASCTFSPLFLYHKPSLSSDCTLLHTVAIQNPQLCIQYEFFSSVDLYSLIIINQSSFTAFNLSFCTSEILLVGHVSLHYMLLSVSQVKKQLVQIFTDKSWVYLIFLYCNSNIVKALIFIQRQFQLFYRRYCFISPSVLNENIQIILPFSFQGLQNRSATKCFMALQSIARVTSIMLNLRGLSSMVQKRNRNTS